MSIEDFRDPAMEEELHLGGLHPEARRSVFGDLTAYLGKPIERIAEEYWAYHQGEDLERQRLVGQAKTAAEVNAYYAQTPHYLYELSYWEASLDKQAWFKVLGGACRRQGFRAVLDFGGGVGGVSVNLARAGFTCAHLDVAGKTSAYAQWRFNRHGLNVQMINVLEGWPEQSFDAIVAWDVLEHIFELEQAVQTIADHLNPGGWLISMSTFADAHGHHEEIHLAKHARYHDMQEFNAMVCSTGLAFCGQLKPDRISRLLRRLGLRYAVAGHRIAPKLKHGGNFLVHEKPRSAARACANC